MATVMKRQINTVQGNVMSLQTRFNDDEWFLLSATPGMVGAAMSNAAPSGIFGTIKEMSAGMRATIEGTQNFPDSELIRELTAKAENWEEAKEKMADYRERTKARIQAAEIKTREALQTMALEDCEAALKIVDAQCSAEDASSYREWTLHIARSVAEAAKEGSVLGFGGERVSEKEREFLARLEKVLGMEQGVLIA